MAKKKVSVLSAEMLDELLDGQDPATVLSSDGLLGELKKALAERMLNAEIVNRRAKMTHLEGFTPPKWGSLHAR